MDSRELIASSKAALAIFLDDPSGLHVICNFFRMDLVWPRRTDTIPLSSLSLGLIDYTPSQRRRVLKTMEIPSIHERLCEVEVILSMFEDHADSEKDLFDVCLDLLELS